MMPLSALVARASLISDNNAKAKQVYGNLNYYYMQISINGNLNIRKGTNCIMYFELQNRASRNKPPKQF